MERTAVRLRPWMRSVCRVAVVAALGTVSSSRPLLAQAQPVDTTVASCARTPTPIGRMDDTVYASLRSVGSDTLPEWYRRALLESLIQDFTLPSPLDVPVVGGPVHAPAHAAEHMRGVVITALGLGATRGRHLPPRRAPPPQRHDEDQPPAVQPESVSVAITAEVEFALHRDGRLGRPRIFTSSLSPTFDASLLHSVLALDSSDAVSASSAPIRDDSLVLIFTARDSRDSTELQEPLFHATVPVWMMERPVFARRHNPIPQYPENAERARIGDEVSYAFVVDATGAPRMETLRLLHGKYQDFQRAILAVLPEWKFFPAMISGCPVAQAVRMPIRFRADY